MRNGLIDRRPALIARCSGTADVVACVNFARERGLLLSVRGGAHNVAATPSMTAVWSSTSRICAVSGSTQVLASVMCRAGNLGRLDRETQLFGLAVPGGVVSTTGIGGLTLHGG